MGPSVFLSFAIEDKPLVELFRGQARNARSRLTFRDYSIREPLDGLWKRRAERLIRVSTGTICLLGATTWRSAPVNWEIRKSVQLGKRVLAVNLRPGPLRIPAALAEVGVGPLPWNISAIVEALNGLENR